MITLPSTHGDKLKALLENSKLPQEDKQRIDQAIGRYTIWRSALTSVKGTRAMAIREMVNLLNEYKLYLDLELIFDSASDFLYRQKGQLKLDNSVIEEFLPIFITSILSDELSKYGLRFGAKTCFSSIYFDSNLVFVEPGGGLHLREKDQDFVIGRDLYIRSSHDPEFSQNVTKHTTLAYVVVECKTNLDKTMFQEAAATALDLKTSIPSAKYYLLCEWLDMTPINSSVTAIDEVIILRKAKRLGSELRSKFHTFQGRRSSREFYEAYLTVHPYAEDMFSRLIEHILTLISDSSEDDILAKGHF